RVVSPNTFSYSIPDDNIYQISDFTYPAQTVFPTVADGVYLMLAPLSPGVHVLHWTGAAPGFTQDITYQVTVSTNWLGRRAERQRSSRTSSLYPPDRGGSPR